MKYTRKMFLISAALTAAVSLSQAPLSLAAQKDDIAAALELLNDSQRAEYYKTVAGFYTENGLDIPEDIKSGLAKYSGSASESGTKKTVTSETAETTAETLAPTVENTSADNTA
jgi:hypothetical protein